MKSDSRSACGQQPRPADSQMNHCLPFCGLGAEAYVQRQAKRCGMLRQEPRAHHAGELSDTVTES